MFAFSVFVENDDGTKGGRLFEEESGYSFVFLASVAAVCVSAVISFERRYFAKPIADKCLVFGCMGRLRVMQ